MAIRPKLSAACECTACTHLARPSNGIGRLDPMRPKTRWVRIEHATTAERARRAAAVARSAAKGYNTSHDKVFTASTKGAR
jgi:hypothetical protein